MKTGMRVLICWLPPFNFEKSEKKKLILIYDEDGTFSINK